MEKILPLNRTNERVNECWTTLRLAAILSDDSFLPWFVEKFITLRLNTFFHTGYYDMSLADWGVEYYYLYDEVLEFKRVTDSKNIVDQLIETINQNGYGVIHWDLFHITNNPYHEKQHVGHEALIYGYDDHRKEFYYLDMLVGNDPLSTVEKISYDVLDRAFTSYIEFAKGDPMQYDLHMTIDGPASMMYLKKPTIVREPKLERINYAVRRSLNGGIYQEVNAPPFGYTPFQRVGISVYEGYYSDLTRVLKEENKNLLKEDVNIAYSMYKLLECKNGLLFRLNYLEQHQYIRMGNDLPNQLKDLCHLIQNGRTLYVKYSLTLQDKYLEQANDHYKRAEELDHHLLTQVKDLTYHARQGLI